jgi:hypothetical protein
VGVDPRTPVIVPGDTTIVEACDHCPRVKFYHPMPQPAERSASVMRLVTMPSVTSVSLPQRPVQQLLRHLQVPGHPNAAVVGDRLLEKDVRSFQIAAAS